MANPRWKLALVRVIEDLDSREKELREKRARGRLPLDNDLRLHEVRRARKRAAEHYRQALNQEIPT